VPPLEDCRLPPRHGAHPVTSWLDPDGDGPPPSLHRHYPTSSVLQGSPPLTGASVLSASWVRHLYLFSSHRQSDSQVPYESLNQSHAPYAPDTAQTVSRFPLCSSRNRVKAPVLMSFLRLTMLDRKVCLRSSLSFTLDVIIVTPFNQNVHHRGHWTEAAFGSLKPPPTGRPRRTLPSSFVQHDAFASS
jgi:hypothetical protein